MKPPKNWDSFELEGREVSKARTGGSGLLRESLKVALREPTPTTAWINSGAARSVTAPSRRRSAPAHHSLTKLDPNWTPSRPKATA